MRRVDVPIVEVARPLSRAAATLEHLEDGERERNVAVRLLLDGDRRDQPQVVRVAQTVDLNELRFRHAVTTAFYRRATSILPRRAPCVAHDADTSPPSPSVPSPFGPGVSRAPPDRREALTLTGNDERTCGEYRHHLAIRFAQAPVERRNRAGEPPPLWRAHDIAGWPELLGGKCTNAWTYLLRLWNRYDFLHDFFPLARDFQVGLASHGMLLSLLELASDSRSLIENNRIEDVGSLDAPAMFATMGSDLIAAAHRRVFGNGTIVEDTLRHAGANPDDVRRLWPG